MAETLSDLLLWMGSIAAIDGNVVESAWPGGGGLMGAAT